MNWFGKTRAINFCEWLIISSVEVIRGWDVHSVGMASDHRVWTRYALRARCSSTTAKPDAIMWEWLHFLPCNKVSYCGVSNRQARRCNCGVHSYDSANWTIAIARTRRHLDACRFSFGYMSYTEYLPLSHLIFRDEFWVWPICQLLRCFYVGRRQK